MAGADEFKIEILGKGGHGAMPHQTIDPVVAAAAVVSSLQHLVSRVTNPVVGSVVSVTRFSTGRAMTHVHSLGFVHGLHCSAPGTNEVTVDCSTAATQMSFFCFWLAVGYIAFSLTIEEETLPLEAADQSCG